MLARASAPIEHDRQAVLFYLYSENLAALRDHLLANGVAVGEIADPRPRPRDGPRRSRRLLIVGEIE